MVFTPRNVLLGNPVQDDWIPNPKHLALLLEQMERLAAGDTVAARSAAELDLVAVGDADRWGVVRGAAMAAENGYYLGDSGTGAWEKVRGLPDTLAVLAAVAGTGNAITADTEPGVDPAEVRMVLLLDPPGTNGAGGVTLRLNGGAVESVTTASGGVLATGDIQHHVATWFVRSGSGWVQPVPSRTGATMDVQGQWSALQTYTRAQFVTQSNKLFYLDAETSTGESPEDGAPWVLIVDFTEITPFIEGYSRQEATSLSFGGSVKIITTNGYAVGGDLGGADYKRISFAELAGYPAASYFRSTDRYMPDGSTDATNGGYWVICSTRPTPKMFGAVGDYDTDDTAAVLAWLAFFAVSRKPLGGGLGVYRLTDNIQFPEGVVIYGEGNAKIASFPQTGGDKSLLRPGYKSRIKGTAFVFDGSSPSTSYTTTRSDRFSSQKPCMIYSHFAPCDLRDFAIIQDMDVLDSGGSMTTAGTDNRSAAYDAGLLLTCTQGNLQNLTVFGYFDNAGVIIAAKNTDGISDPDYNQLSNCLITSGLAIIGGDTASVGDTGLTGTEVVQCGLYGADHHERTSTDPDVPTLFIDINLATTGEGRGHTFLGCNFRGYANTAIKFDHCDDISILGGTTEFSQVAAAGLNSDGEIVGTGNTQRLRLMGLAATGGLGIGTLINTVQGPVQVIGAGGFDGAYFAEHGRGVALHGASDDAVVQLTDDFSSTVTGWTMRLDSSNSDAFEMRYDGAALHRLKTDGALDTPLRLSQSSATTISSGAITRPSQSYVQIETEGAAASDDLDTINGGTQGDMIILKAASSSRTVVVKDSTGNLRLAGDFNLDNGQDSIGLIFDGATWNELFRSDNSA